MDELARGRDVHRRIARDRRDDWRGGAGRPRRRAVRDRGREPRRRRVGEQHSVRAGGGPAPRRRRRRVAARAACADADARPGQADLGGERRGRGARAVLAQRRRGRQAPRRAPAEQRHPGQEGAALPASARRDRRHHALELAVHDAGGADRACARKWQHRRLDARVDDGDRRDRTRRVRRRGRPAARRLQPRHRARLARRRRDRPQPRHARHRVHRLDRDGTQGRRGRSGKGRRARARRQRPDRGARRRGPRPRRRGDGHGLLSLCRPELHRGRAPARAPRRAGGVRCEARTSRHGARSAWRSVRREDVDGPAEQRRRRAEDGRARCRRARARGRGRERRLPRRRLPDEALLAGDRARQRLARVARRTG